MMKKKSVAIIITTIVAVVGGTFLLTKYEKYSEYAKINEYLLKVTKGFNEYKMNNNEIEKYNSIINNLKKTIELKQKSEIGPLENQLNTLNEEVREENLEYINEQMEKLQNYMDFKLTKLQKDKVNVKILEINKLKTNGDYLECINQINSLENVVGIYKENINETNDEEKLIKANEFIDTGKLKLAQNIMNSISYTTLNKKNKEEYDYLRIIMDEKFKAKGEVIIH